MINKLTLPWPVLFLEFFVREVAFKGKGIVRSTLPADAHFYTGGSKSPALSPTTRKPMAKLYMA